MYPKQMLILIAGLSMNHCLPKVGRTAAPIAVLNAKTDTPLALAVSKYSKGVKWVVWSMAALVFGGGRRGGYTLPFGG